MDRGIRGRRLISGSDVPPQRDATRLMAPIAPDLAIRIAYAFGSNLRSQGSDVADFDRLASAWVERRFAGTALLPQVRAGFAAGFRGVALSSIWSVPTTDR